MKLHLRSLPPLKNAASPVRRASWLPVVMLASAPLFDAAATDTPPVDPATEPVVKLANFVVTGTRTRQAADSAPVRVDVVVASEFERLGARTFADAMEYVPGVQVESNCQSCNTSEIRMLGLSGNYNQIAFDGLPLLSSLAGVYGVEQMPASFIERIEIVKGGGSSLYGASAVAGVVNIISRRPVVSGGSFDYRFDSIRGAPAHQANLVADHVSVDRRSMVSGYAQVARAPAVDLNHDGYSENPRRRMEVVGTRGRWERGGFAWTAELNHTHENRRGGNRFDEPAHLANIAEALVTRRTAATLALEARPHGAFDYRLVAAVAYTERDSYYGGLGDVVTDPADPTFDPTAYAGALDASRRQYGYTKNPLYVVEAQFNHHFAAHTLTWGAQGEFEDVHDENRDDTGARTGSPPLEGGFRNVAVFVQDDWRLSERWTLLSGARLDKNNQLDDPVISPRVAVRYAADRYVSFRGSVGTGFRSPRIFDEDLHVNTLGADPISIVNAPNLKKEGAVTANLGIVWNPRPVADVLALEANVFTARLRDAFQLSEIRTAADGSLFQERFNAGGVRVYGAEFNVAYSFSPRLRADLGVVGQQSRLDESTVIFDDGDGTVIETKLFNKAPERFAVLTLQYENERAFDWSVGVRYMGSMHVLDNNTATFARSKSFLVVDASVGRHLRWAEMEWLVQIGVKNITDDRQKDLESGALRDSDYVYGPRSPRTFFTSVNLAW